MAIELEIIEYSDFASSGGDRVAVGRGPWTRQRITAAGLSAAFGTDTKLIEVCNFGDAVYIRLNDTDITTNAATGDANSRKLRATSHDVAIKIDPLLAVKLDVRAA